MKYIIIYFTLALLSTVGVSIANASTWVQKPIQCGEISSADKLVFEADEDFMFRGNGVVYNSLGQLGNAIIGVYANPETGTFTIVEVYPENNEACVIAFGDNLEFTIPEAQDRHPRGIDPKRETRI